MAGGSHHARRRAALRRTTVVTLLVAVLTAGMVATASTGASGADTPLNVLATDRVDLSDTGAQLTTSCSGFSYYGGACGTTLSADGRQTSFVTADPAVASDVNSNWDAYVRDSVSGTTTRVSLADDGGDAWGIDAALSGTGRFVAFAGCCDLVPGENQAVGQPTLTLSSVTGRFYASPGDTTA